MKSGSSREMLGSVRLRMSSPTPDGDSVEAKRAGSIRSESTNMPLARSLAACSFVSVRFKPRAESGFQTPSLLCIVRNEYSLGLNPGHVIDLLLLLPDLSILTTENKINFPNQKARKDVSSCLSWRVNLALRSLTSCRCDSISRYKPYITFRSSILNTRLCRPFRVPSSCDSIPLTLSYELCTLISLVFKTRSDEVGTGLERVSITSFSRLRKDSVNSLYTFTVN